MNSQKLGKAGDGAVDFSGNLAKEREIPSRIGSLSRESLGTLSSKGTVKGALTFAGQGVVGLDELARSYDESALRREYIEAAAEALRRYMAEKEVRWSGLYAYGFELIVWLKEPAKRPPLEYLTSSVISQPLIFIDQIVQYLLLYERGLKGILQGGGISVLTGHSQGMMPALLLSESGAELPNKERFVEYVLYMAWQGLFMAQSFEGAGYEVRRGEATPMAAITGLTHENLEKMIQMVNARLPKGTALEITLHNTRTRFVVSGEVAALEMLKVVLEQRAERESEKKKKGLFAGRPSTFTWEYLLVGGAYHSSYMTAGMEFMLRKVEEIGFRMDAQKLHFDVISPASTKLYNESADLTKDIVYDQFVHSVHWRATLLELAKRPEVAYILDLGPGDGVARLTSSVLRGQGMFVFATVLKSEREKFFSKSLESLDIPLSYERFKPYVIRFEDGTLGVENRYTRATGHRPFILPGMTPTTVEVPLVAAAANADFTAELAGGGQTTEEIFWTRMDELKASLKMGKEIIFNALYLDPYLWDLHIRKTGLVQKARKAGYPLCGVTISAGLPEVDEAVALLDEFTSIGLWLNAFKPGTLDQVKKVVQIAKAAPHQTIFVHLEGGKAGGHHSWEDLEELLLESYHLIREQENLILCVGGGIGDEERAKEFLLGEWATKYDFPKMPVDAVFLGTIAMAALEAATSPQVKQALVEAAGHSGWVLTGQFTNGMTSGRSSLDADIYYIDNAAARCGRLLDELSGDVEAIEARRDEIIEMLNRTAKPFFGELSEMTYREVAERMVELMAIGEGGAYEDGRWLDRSYRRRFEMFLQRAAARLTEQQEGQLDDFIGEFDLENAPEKAIEAFVQRFPRAETESLHPLDVRHFIHEICTLKGKPVNFVPVIDAQVRRWYKSDSLWQSHHPRYEADQVLILPSPESIQGLTKADEPIAELFGRFESALLSSLQPEEGEETLSLPSRRKVDLPEGIVMSEDEWGIHLLVEEDSERTLWFDFIASHFEGPIAEFFASKRLYLLDSIHQRKAFLQGVSSTPNPIFSLCRQEKGASLQLFLSEGLRISKVLYRLPTPTAEEKLSLAFEGEVLELEIQIPAVSGEKMDAPYRLEIGRYLDRIQPVFWIERSVQRENLRNFYHHALFGGSLEVVPLFETATEKVLIDENLVRGYAAATSGKYRDGLLPINMTFSLLWKPLFRLLSADEFVGELLQLVHLSNRIELGEGWPLRRGDEVDVHSTITHVEHSEKGSLIETVNCLFRGEYLAATVYSSFFIRGYFAKTPYISRTRKILVEAIELDSQGTIDFLLEHSWLKWSNPSILKVGETLTFEVKIEEDRKRSGERLFAAAGSIKGENELVGTVDLKSTESLSLHPMMALLKAIGTKKEQDVSRDRRLLAREVAEAPQEMSVFAEVGGDLNPIHRSFLMARLGGLERPIVHGMWTAARLSNFLVEKVAQGDPKRLLNYEAEFIAPVLPSERLYLEAVHLAMRDGDLVVEAVASVQREDSLIPAVRATALIQPKKTAYIFPGQGIQQKGMGMEGYSRSKAARQIWERADLFSRKKLGFSILEIVRENPKELIVNGELLVHPQGVLYLTQFTQVAMAVLAQAQVAEMKEAGVFRRDAIFCGHSVGEYNAIAISGILPLETVVELVYLRGLMMHTFVKRDEKGESGYRMAVIRPHYAGFKHEQAEALVAQVAESTGEFIQIVNYNVRDRQYSVTGTIEALEILQKELAKHTKGAKAAYVEIPGLDVPFHSKILVEGVPDFRKTLQERLPQRISYEELAGRYIPNLVPRAFSVDREYIEEVANYTNSEILFELLEHYDERVSDKDDVARVLLIELLAWQFASPVRWIETQELLFAHPSFGGLGVERIVEIGVGYQPTLANMARYSLKLQGLLNSPIEILNVEAEADRVFYREVIEIDEFVLEELSAKDTVISEESAKMEEAVSTESKPEESSAQPISAPAPMPSQSTVSADELAHYHVSIKEALMTLLAIQAKVRIEQIDEREDIDELFDGVSSRRNQVLLDIGAEFNIGPIDGAHEKPLVELIAELEKRASSYKSSGKYLRATQDDTCKRVFGRAGMGRKEISSYLQKTFGLGDGLIDQALNLLILETREGQSNRGGQLGALAGKIPADKASAQALLDELVALLGARLGLGLAKQNQAAGSASQAVDAAVVEELEEKILGADGVLMNVAKELALQLGHSLDDGGAELPETLEEQKRLELYESEHGKEYERLIQPRFDARKHVAFTSAWASAQRDIARLFFDRQNGKLSDEEILQKARRLASFASLSRVADTARWYEKAARKADDEWFADILAKIASAQTEPTLPIHLSRPHVSVEADGSIRYEEQTDSSFEAFSQWLNKLFEGQMLHLSSHFGGDSWDELYRHLLERATEQSFDFRGKTAVVTGASPHSIAVEVVRHLLRGGAQVVVTTSSYNEERLRFYRELYESEASMGAELHVVPFNQASYRDVEALINWLFGAVTEQAGASVRYLKKPFAPDLLLPFGAIKDLATMDVLGERSDAVMRAMLLGLERLIAGIAARYREHGLPQEPCHVILPLSPNHGNFGGDGVYAETKIALETLLNKWRSEYDAWGEAVSLCAAKIGWVRGTGLMDANNLVAPALEEKAGVRTFSNAEMGLLIVALNHTEVRKVARKSPLIADLSAGFADIEDLPQFVADIRAELDARSEAAKRRTSLNAQERQLLGRAETQNLLNILPNWPQMTIHYDSFEKDPLFEKLGSFEGSATLEDTIVIVGAGEVGPYGSSRVRFDVEVDGELSAASVLELAWTTGLINYEDDGRGGVWKDTETGETVEEWEIAERYRERLKERMGIRFVEEESAGFSSEALSVLTSVFLERDFTFPVLNEEEARSFVLADPEHTKAHYNEEMERWEVTRLAGTEVRVARKVRSNRNVAGMIPKGFDFERLGIPKDMLENTDRVTLFNLIATVDAFVSAGLTPEELLRWIHPARVGNTQGSGIGGMQSLRRLYLDHFLDRERQNDTLQETLINVVAAYVVQSYVGSYGSMAHPVGACATAAVSLEDGVDKLLAKKVDFVVAGGFDDIGREGLIGFQDMNATANSDDMLAMGLSPAQMSRPNDVRRRGFIEAQGGGTFLLTRGDIALKMGLPVFGVVAYAASYGDGIHKSIPAPGMGALAAAMGGKESPLAQALKRYNLTADEIAFVYKHDTSTNANDPNENELHHRIQEAIGRTKGNPLFVVSQKALTGHPKGGAAAWQLIGVCQAMERGLIAGNPNLDSVDEAMRRFEHLAFSSSSLHVGRAQKLRAALLTSLGFGHVSGIALIVHRDAFLHLIPDEKRDAYLAQARRRKQQEKKAWTASILGEQPFFEKRTQRRFQAQDGSHAQAEEEARLLLDKNAFLDPQTGLFRSTPPESN